MGLSLVAALGTGLLSGRMQMRLRLLLVPLLLAATVGLRLEVVGLAGGLVLLCLPISKKSEIILLQEIAAATVAVFAGFRIDFVTNPSGGFIYLYSIAVPATIAWVVLVMRLREGIRRALPRPWVQVSIDLIIVANACLLALATSDGNAIVRALPFVLLGIVATSLIAVSKGKDLGVFHRGVVFCLALYGIGGAMKGAISLALLLPFALIAVPMLTTSQAFFSHGAAYSHTRPVPRLLSRWGDGIVVSYLALAGGLSLGVILAVHRSSRMGLLALAVIPAVASMWWLGRRLSQRRALEPGADANGRIGVLGVSFDNISCLEAGDTAMDMLNQARTHVIVTPNTVSVMRARKDVLLRESYQRADLVLADGIGVVWSSRLIGSPLRERVTGIDLTEHLLQQATVSGNSVYILGGREGVAQRAAARLCRRFPGLNIVGAHHGYFDDDDSVVSQIQACEPDILLVGMGVPKQERFMLENRNRLPVHVMIGIGGALDVFAGDCARAPHIWQSLGLEWLYRMLRQPRRMKRVWAIPALMLKSLVTRLAISIERFISLPEEEI